MFFSMNYVDASELLKKNFLSTTVGHSLEPFRRNFLRVDTLIEYSSKVICCLLLSKYQKIITKNVRVNDASPKFRGRIFFNITIRSIYTSEYARPSSTSHSLSISSFLFSSLSLSQAHTLSLCHRRTLSNTPSFSLSPRRLPFSAQFWARRGYHLGPVPVRSGGTRR